MVSQILIILGSKTDEDTLIKSGMLDILQALGIKWKLHYISAHRNPDDLRNICLAAAANGAIKIIIAAAGMMPGLPGSVASWVLPHILTLGVVLDSSSIKGKHTIATAISMPSGVPLPYAGIGEAGLKNAALIAAQIISAGDQEMAEKLSKYWKDNNKNPTLDAMTSETYNKPLKE
jgi:5-(carboxyamino)imidazole ribonucleotide mutase